MANKIDTLHPKDDLETNIYPNIVSDNIPSNAITTDKIKDGSVTNNKLDDGCVTNDKIKDDTILGSKINTNTNITCNTLEATNIIGTQMIGQYVQADIQLQANNDLNVLGSSTLKGKVIANGDLIVNGTAYFTSPSITGVASVSGLKSPANMAISAVTDIDFIIGDYTISVPKASGTIALKSEVEEESEKRELNDNQLQEQIVSEVGTRKEADSNLQEQITNSQTTLQTNIDKKANTTDLDTLKSSVNSNWSTLMANLGIGRWSGQHLYAFGTNPVIYDNLAPSYTTYQRYLANASFDGNVIFNQDFNTSYCNYRYAFYNMTCSTLTLPNMNIGDSQFMFASFQGTKILVAEGKNVNIMNTLYYPYTFEGCPNLVEIGTIDLSRCTYISNMFINCSKLKSIHCTHFKASFIISYSTAFEESDLVEIISNLDAVTTAQTLTMGTTNLAKLTDAEKKVATDKGWVLA